MENFISIIEQQDILYEKKGNTIIIRGDLDLINTQIKSLPDNLSVGRSLDLENTQITGVLYSKNIGSRKSQTTYWIKKDKISCGCFTGTLREFENRVHETYNKNSKYRKEYDEFIEEIINIKFE